MAIDIDLFHFQLSDLETARVHLVGSVRRLKANGELKGFFGLFTASPEIPGPPDEEALEEDARTESRTERRLREMLARMSYVFGVTCLEHLLEQCVREVLQAQPQRVLGIGDWWRDGNLVRRQVVDGWSRDQVIAELVKSAVESFGKQPFTEVRKYFEKRLEVSWTPEWREDLLRIVNLRNRAAHTLDFREPADEEIVADLHTILRHGESIARAVAAKHGLPLRSVTIDKERAELLEEDEGV